MTNKLMHFIGNWKMYGDLSSIKDLKSIDLFLKKKKKFIKSKIVMCVPSTLIHPFSKLLQKSHISIGAQNCYHEANYGPFTGSVSAKMLKSVGAKYIIVGHSENRAQGDTNKIIKQKINLSFRENLNIIFCIGETLKDKRRKKTFKVLKNQIDKSIGKNVNLNKIIFAYEPIWSIGTGKILNTSELSNIIKFIKRYVKNRIKSQYKPKVLYGGSVNHKNIRKFNLINEIDGFLIGGASISSKKFIDIIKNYYKQL